MTTEYLTLSQAAKVCPNRPNASTIWRWCRRGVKARDNSKVYLEHRRFGGKVFTTSTWLDNFGAELANRDATHFKEADSQGAIATTTKTRTSAQRKQSFVKAEAELEAAGIA